MRAAAHRRKAFLRLGLLNGVSVDGPRLFATAVEDDAAFHPASASIEDDNKLASMIQRAKSVAATYTRTVGGRVEGDAKGKLMEASNALEAWERRVLLASEGTPSLAPLLADEGEGMRGAWTDWVDAARGLSTLLTSTKTELGWLYEKVVKIRFRKDTF